jgi:hypothetical protein
LLQAHDIGVEDDAHLPAADRGQESVSGQPLGLDGKLVGQVANLSYIGSGHQLDDLAPGRAFLDLRGRDGGDADDRLHIGQGAGLA